MHILLNDITTQSEMEWWKMFPLAAVTLHKPVQNQPCHLRTNDSCSLLFKIARSREAHTSKDVRLDVIVQGCDHARTCLFKDVTMQGNLVKTTTI